MSGRYKMNKVSVLIVESSKSVIDHLSNKFSDMGLSVITALDGFEGYVRACNEMPNYVVAAGVLPSVNGFKLSLLLKNDERYKHIHISYLLQIKLRQRITHFFNLEQTQFFKNLLNFLNY